MEFSLVVGLRCLQLCWRVRKIQKSSWRIVRTVSATAMRIDCWFKKEKAQRCQSNFFWIDRPFNDDLLKRERSLASAKHQGLVGVSRKIPCGLRIFEPAPAPLTWESIQFSFGERRSQKNSPEDKVLFMDTAPHGPLFPRCKVIVHHGHLTWMIPQKTIHGTKGMNLPIHEWLSFYGTCR